MNIAPPPPPPNQYRVFYATAGSKIEPVCVKYCNTHA